MARRDTLMAQFARRAKRERPVASINPPRGRRSNGRRRPAEFKGAAGQRGGARRYF